MWPFNRKKKETTKPRQKYEIDVDKAETFEELRSLVALSLNVTETLYVKEKFLDDYPEAKNLVVRKVDLNNEYE